MRTKYISTLALATLFSGAVNASSYNPELAASYQTFFAPIKGAAAGKNLGLMSPEAFVNSIKAGTDLVAIDIRTPAEMDIFGLSLPGSLAMSAETVFLPENLAKLPTDKPVVIICKSGARATAIGTALRHAGFDNVRILKGGFKGLSGYLGPVQAN
ncbi:rhodanese-like domain-containing protein [Shewanella sp. NIFS-20-20]|uniref:rhodanese-like domain-containing protein n=1 Tax=Shewanella sp. NIFS-20-20 TaxID=2853806 RepID=UPI001C48A013|nr:rhodanese-like domain-containing protein [Shewanella sp. NIFS-20-20]MBV7314719.1 rhodanese-like domain-containing protein [Shewanella sp. NIFS-20-20]